MGIKGRLIIYIGILLVVGILSFLFSIALFFFPEQLKKLNDLGNRILFTDERAIVYRKLAGIFLLCLGIIFFIMSWYFKGR